MRRVLFIAARDDLYGAARALLAHLARFEFASYLATPEDGLLAQAARQLGVQVRAEPAVASSRALKNRLTAPFRLRQLARFAEQEGIERVVAMTLSACPPATAIA